MSLIRLASRFLLPFLLLLAATAAVAAEKGVLDALTALGCDQVQGYFISKPLTYELLENWFSTTSWKLPRA